MIQILTLDNHIQLSDKYIKTNKYYSQSRQNVSSMLDKFIEVNYWTAVSILFFEEHLKSPQFIKCSHIFEFNRKIN